MPSPTPSVSQYRRRVLALGAIPVILLFIVGAAVFNNRIEDDLESRVPAELTELGFDVSDATVHFDGQDGSMSCVEPLADPPAVEDAAYDVWGVHSFVIERSCRTSTADNGDDDTNGDDDADDGSDGSDSTSTTSTVEVADTTIAPSTTAEVTVPDFGTLNEVITTDPQYSTFARLAAEVDLAAELGDPASGPFTMFAPTNDAFEALDPAQFATLEADPELLQTVVGHHLVAELHVDLGDAAPTTFMTTSDTQLELADATTVGGATISGGAVSAANGVAYTVDALLIPSGVDLTPEPELATTTARFADGAIELNGAVVSEAERAMLVAPAMAAVGAENVIDNILIDDIVGLGPDDAATLGDLIGALTTTLVRGEAAFDGETFSVTGLYANESDRDAMLLIGETLGVDVSIEARPDATTSDAAEIEAQLNAIVAENPILFDAGSDSISAESLVVIDQLANEAAQFSGVSIVVVGHTDSDGAAAANQSLSERRAEAVRQALITRGLDEAQLSAVGFGEDELIIVDGVEDKAASRRVVFEVAVAP